MKKWITVMMLLLLTAVLGACSSAGEDAEAVYTKAFEVAEEMNSAEVVIDMNQQMIMGDMEPVEITSKMEGKVITDPLAMYQKGTIQMAMEELPMDMEMEMYLVDNEMYMYESLTGQWLKLDDSMMPMELMENQQQNLTDQMKMLEEYVDHFEMEETDEAYVLKLTLDGESLQTITDEVLGEAMPQDLLDALGEEGTALFESMELANLYVEMFVDKDTFETKEYLMDAEMSMDIEGQKMNIKVKTNTEYFNINGVESIELPQEVKDNAVEGIN